MIRWHLSVLSFILCNLALAVLTTDADHWCWPLELTIGAEEKNGCEFTLQPPLSCPNPGESQEKTKQMMSLCQEALNIILFGVVILVIIFFFKVLLFFIILRRSKSFARLVWVNLAITTTCIYYLSGSSSRVTLSSLAILGSPNAMTWVGWKVQFFLHLLRVSRENSVGAIFFLI